MNIEEGIKLDFSDVLIRPKRSNAPSRQSIELVRTIKMPNAESRQLTFVPIIASNMSATGTFAMGEATRKLKMLTAIHKFYPLAALVNNFNENNCFFTVGLKDEDFEKLEAFAKVRLPNKICIDAANGYTCYFVEKVKRLRERFPYAILMAGNVCTPEMTQELILAGADIVKVGIGSGSVCTTRLMTGVGFPQFAAVADCADSAHGLGGLVCSDGGATTPGDVAKAMGAGADLVMLGGMLAGTDECEGNEVDGDFEFFGMSSDCAQDLFYGGRKNYAAAEGKVVRIPHKGPVTPILEEIMGGLRSACSYVGASTLKDFSKCCSFVRVSRTHNTVFGG